MVYDGLLILAMWMATLFPLVALSNTVVTGAAVQSLLFIELFGFFTYFWVFRGQTLGMLAWRLVIVSQAPQPITLIQVILRFVAALASFVCLGLGYLWIFVDPERRSWSDMFSDTKVLYQPKNAA